MNEQTPYSPLTIANFFIEHSDQGVSHLKLQKLVYCAYGWWLTVKDQDDTVLTTEPPQAWKYGPVFPSLYQALGRQRPRRFFSNPFFFDGREEWERLQKDDIIQIFLMSVWRRYSPYNGFTLSYMTHKEGSSWDQQRKTENGQQGDLCIPDALIENEFQKIKALDKEVA